MSEAKFKFEHLLPDYNKKAEEHFAFLQNLVNKSESSDDNCPIEIRADAYFELGLILFYQKDQTKAINFIENAQKYYSKLKNTIKVASCMTELSWMYYCKHPENLIRSLNLLNDAKYLLEVDENYDIKTKIYHYYGLISYREKKYAEALNYFKKAQNLPLKDPVQLAKVEDSLGVHYSRIGDFQVAINYFKSSLKKKYDLKNWREIAITQQLLGRLYLRLDDLENSKYHLNTALEISKSLGGSKKLCRLYCDLAKIFYIIGEYDKSEEYCISSIKLAKENSDSFAYAFAYLEYSNLLIMKGQPKEVLDTINSEINPIFNKNNSIRGLAYTKRQEAKCLYACKSYAKALERFHESLEMFKDTGYTIEIAKSHLELSNLYKLLNEDKLALSSIREALRFAELETNNMLIKTIEDEISNISESEWFNVIDKRSNNYKTSEDSLSLIDALTTLGLSKALRFKDPLLSLLRVGQAMAAETNMENLLFIITEEIKKALNTDRATVFLLNKETQELWSIIATGMGKQEIRFPAHLGLAGHVAMSGEIINIQDAYTDSRFNKDIDKQTGYRTKTVLCVPMRNFKHEIIGVFQVINKLDGDYFSPEDEVLLVAIASSAAISIENANLFKKQAELYENQIKSFNSFINTLAGSIDARDKITAGHSKRVTEYTIRLAKQMNLTDDEVETLEYAALLHDFGKIGVLDKVLCKEGILTEEEYIEIKKHAFITKELLDQMYFQEKLKNVPEIAASHHEKYDGTGYFRGLKGEEIPLGGRIMAVADVFDAITSKRHYRDRMPMIKVLNIMIKDSGSHFDPNVIKYFFDINFADILKVIITSDNAKLSDSDHELFAEYSVKTVYNILKKDKADRINEEITLIDKFKQYYERRS